MVKFKSWADSYRFLKEYGSFTCLQCKGNHQNIDVTELHKDNVYARFFCSKTVAMVRLDFQFSCPQWESKDGKELTDEDMDKCMFDIPLGVIDVLAESDKEWTFEDIVELIEDYEEVKE